MDIKTLRADMITAMKAKNKPRKEAISSLVSAAKKVAIDEGCREDIADELVDRVILKELKTAKEQLDSCPEDRTDLREEYQVRYDMIKEYAPKLMEEDEVRAFLTENFQEVLESKNKGLIMKNVMPALKGKADGKMINRLVAEFCN